MIEELGEILGLHLVGGLGKAGDIGEAYRQLLPLAGDPDILAAGEYRAVHLRRQIFRQLAGKRLEGRGFLGEVLLPLLQLRDVRIDGDRAAGADPPLAYHDPSPVASPLHLRFARVAVPGQPLGDPFLDPPLGIPDVAALGGSANDVLECRAGRQFGLKTGVEQFAVAAVAEDEPVLRVVESESLGDALDGIDEPLTRFGNLAQVLFLDLDCGVPEQPERLGHAPDFVAARGRQRRTKIAAGDREHALAHRPQTGEEAAVDIEPDNQNRTQEAEKGGAEDNSGTVALDDRGFATGRSDLAGLPRRPGDRRQR